VLAALAGSRGTARAGLTLAGSLLAGLSAALIADTWLGIVEGDWLANAGAFALTQLLPPGAGANLLRSTGFFDGAGAGEHIAVLAVWALLGLAATMVTRSAHGTLMRPVSSSA